MAVSAHQPSALLAATLHPSTRPPSSSLDSLGPPHLPNGPCNFRDLNLGSHAGSCGCQHFWRVEAYSEPNHLKDKDAGSAGKAWCFCGHHACYHTFYTAFVGSDEDHGQHSQPDGASNSQGPPQPRVQPSASISRRQEPSLHPRTLGQGSSPAVNQFRSSATFKAPSSYDKNSQQRREQRKHKTPFNRHIPSPVPQARSKVHGAPKNGATGLGLYCPDPQGRPTSPAQNGDNDGHESRLPSTQPFSRSPSEYRLRHGDSTRHSPSRSFMEHVSQMRSRQPLLQTAFDVPNLNNHDLVQSATEVATPSNQGTPALRGAADAFDSIKNGMDDLERNFLATSNRHGVQAATSNGVRSNSTGQVNRPSVEPSDGDRKGDQHSSASVNALVSQIAALRNFLASSPDLGLSLRHICNRLDALETVSFSHGSVDDLNERFELFDGRMLEIEGKVEDLEKFRRTYDQEATLLDGDPLRSGVFRPPSSHHGDLSPENARHDPTSSDSILHDAKTQAILRLKNLEERLEALESSTGPSAASPWEIEIVLLPWGKELRGIWSPSDLASNGSALTTQESGNDVSNEDGINSHNVLPMQQKSSMGLRAKIKQEWRTNSNPWHAARACGAASGSGGRVYDRLRSRGLVKKVVLRHPSAEYISSLVCSSYGDLLTLDPTGSAKTFEEQGVGAVDAEGNLQHLLGLRSPFIPLRKVHKASRLHFLSPSELATPALWDAHFLDSSVFMKAPGKGITRLFITTPAAYFAQFFNSGWTWQKLRELPRFDAGPEAIAASTGSFHNQVVEEADAAEPCWTFDAKLDPPSAASANSSFASGSSFQPHASFSSSHPLSPSASRQASEPGSASGFASESEDGDRQLFDAERHRQMTPNMHLAPITPLSEYPPASRNNLLSRRTASFPLPDSGSGGVTLSADHSSQMKRQVASFDNATGSSSLLHSPSKDPDIAALRKRRRVSRTPDFGNADGAASLRAPWGLTPRRSREPGSPMRPMGASASAGMSERKSSEDKKSVQGGSRAQDAYATPYSYNNVLPGPGRQHQVIGDNQGDTDMDCSSEDDEEGNGRRPNNEDQNSRKAAAGKSALELQCSPEDEMEFDEAVTKEEEAWEGVGGGAVEPDGDEDTEDAGDREADDDGDDDYEDDDDGDDEEDDGSD